MSEVLNKYNLLDQSQKKEVENYVDYLIHKHKSKIPKSIESYRKKIITVSTWSKDDIAVLESKSHAFNNLKVIKW